MSFLKNEWKGIEVTWALLWREQHIQFVDNKIMWHFSKRSNSQQDYFNMLLRLTVGKKSCNFAKVLKEGRKIKHNLPIFTERERERKQHLNMKQY